MGSTVTVKGQVTIPKQIRSYLGIEPGDEVSFEYADDGRVVLGRLQAVRKRSAAGPSRFARFRGTGRLGMKTDEVMRMLRGYDEDAKDPGFDLGTAVDR